MVAGLPPLTVYPYTLKCVTIGQFLAHIDEVQEELLYYPGVGISKKFNVKVFYVMGSFLCDGQGAVRRAILSL